MTGICDEDFHDERVDFGAYSNARLKFNGVA